MDPLANSPWSRPGTVAGFSATAPNATLMGFVEGEHLRKSGLRVLDLGCGAGRNACPMAEMGLDVIGIDLSWPMLQAARDRPRRAAGSLLVALSPMDRIPARDRSFDVVIAHGIWNLARSGDEFRLGVREAARVSKPGAGLFVFTFSRNTLPAAVTPVSGETFLFTQFSGQPQCFLTGPELLFELAEAGFSPDPAAPLTEHNRPRPGQLPTGSPVIYEGAFRFKS